MNQLQTGREFRTITIEKRGREKQVRVPSFSDKLRGESLKREVARYCLEACNDNDMKATQLMNNILTADFQLLQRIVDVGFISKQAIDELRREHRMETIRFVQAFGAPTAETTTNG